MLTPEEWVRQHMVRYLIDVKGFPISLISLEYRLSISGTSKRSDIVLFNHDAKPIVIVECKAPSVAITQDTFDQANVYNIALKVTHIIITNGLVHYCCTINPVARTLHFLNEIPNFKDIR